MDYILTKEQIEQIKYLEPKFYNAVYNKFIRSSRIRETKLVYDIYEAVTNKKTNRNVTCGVCILNIYTQLGKIYFNSIEYYNNQNKAQETTFTEEVEQSTTNTKATSQKAVKRAKTKK